MAVLFNSSAFYRRTTNLPTFSAYTHCGWARYPADDNNAHTICGINNAGDTGIQMQVQSDGSTFGFWNGATDTSFARSPVAGRDFFWAIAAGSKVRAFWRYPGQRFFTRLEAANSTAGSTDNLVVGTYFAGSAGSLWIDRCWNVKCWDRELNESQLFAESEFEQVVNKASLNHHWRLSDANDYFDRGPKGNAATSSAGITRAPEFFRLRQLVRPRQPFSFTAAGSVRGIAFGNRGVAFNGGRAFVGPIN